ncbi:hypothetical protein ART_3049 [Arthrobacter sp. PAMC 25486]|nr:hypothetical protein ART_3049 [Arthrobacter sp. PAMC 25486]
MAIQEHPGRKHPALAWAPVHQLLHLVGGVSAGVIAQFSARHGL